MALDMFERALEIKIILVVLRLGAVTFGLHRLAIQHGGITELTPDSISALLVFRDPLRNDIPCALQALFIRQFHWTLFENLFCQRKQSFLDGYIGTGLSMRFVG